MIDNGLNVRDEYKQKTVEELKIISKWESLEFSVLLFNLEHDLNIGNIIRTAHLMGAERVIVIGDRKIDRRACVGSQNYIEIIDKRVNGYTAEELVDEFKACIDTYDLYPIFIEKTDYSKDIRYMNLSKIYHRNPCLVFGNEGAGIPEAILNNSRDTYHIKQRGVLRSLNVASAAAIAMYEVTKLL
jgi:tRNA G18 (ribose-2'-O)-methylase SpoU